MEERENLRSLMQPCVPLLVENSNRTKRYFLSAGGVGAKILKVMASGATPIALTLK